jgi:hypothetical protein
MANLVMTLHKQLIFKDKLGQSLAPGYLRLLVAAPVCVAVALFSAVGAQAELTLGGYSPAVIIEEAVEESVEEAVEESVAEAVDDEVVDRIEEQIEEDTLSLGGYIYDKVEESVEESVEEAVEESIAEVAEEIIEEAVEESVGETIEDNIEQDVQQNIEEIIEDSLEESVAEAVEETVEESVAQAVEETVEESVAQAVEETVEESVAETVEESVEEEVAENVEEGVEEGLERGVESEIAEIVEERLESTIDVILDGVESEFEIDEDRIHKDQWLVMAEPEVFEKLAVEGYLFDKVTELPGIGMRLAEVAAPSSFDITEVRQGVMDVLGSDHAEVDLNHIYTAGAPVSSPSEQGVSPRAAIDFPADTDALALRIGMIDSLVDVSHPSLAGSQIETRSFAPKNATMPDFHGTAIASIIAANTGEYQGLAPNTALYAAGVFEKDKERGEIASTVSLVMALDWLMSSGVDVINISLAGPPNRLLQAALSRAAEKDVMILAAAGNGGPIAKPMYPAAYDSVVAVTAVDSQGKVFRLANRGEYLDLAAPGVSVLHARAGGGYAASSGTSFAVPFAATAAARIRQLSPDANVLELLYQSAEDLGPPGRDEIYGYGLLRPDVLITNGAQTASR